jgi:hypothetical protein
MEGILGSEITVEEIIYIILIWIGSSFTMGAIEGLMEHRRLEKERKNFSKHRTMIDRVVSQETRKPETQESPKICLLQRR